MPATATPSLFAAEAADLAALAELAARSIPRAELIAEGYRNLAKSSDLFDMGYSISHWFNPRTRAELVEYNPTSGAGRPAGRLPRVTATTYAEQAAVHDAIGARVVSPGRQF